MTTYLPFAKYHGLGNDYLAINESDLPYPLTPESVRAICHRHFGIGSDGLLVIRKREERGIPVLVYNPDGSLAETSGNGLRIAARYIYEHHLVDSPNFILLAGGTRKVRATISENNLISVEMGGATFLAKDIPVAGPQREVLNEEVELAGEKIRFSCVSVGNPHCVAFGLQDLKAAALQIGPLLETHIRFPNRTNVQFVRVIDRKNVMIEIWERGAGYTLASGSSSCAVAAVCHRLDLVDNKVSIHMPGGTLHVDIQPHFFLTLTGPVTKVGSGVIDREVIDWKSPLLEALHT